MLYRYFVSAQKNRVEFCYTVYGLEFNQFKQILHFFGSCKALLKCYATIVLHFTTLQNCVCKIVTEEQMNVQ